MMLIIALVCAAYGGLLLIAAVRTRALPAWALAGNAVAAAALIGGLWWPRLIPLGLAAQWIMGLTNGVLLNGVPNWRHFAVRTGLTVGLLILWWLAAGAH